MKRISRRNFLKAMGISATALTLAACGGSSSSTAAGTAGSTAASAVATGEPKAGGTLRLCYSSPIATPGYTPRATGNAAIYYLTLSYESLTSYDAEGNMIPNLATEWDVNTDELSITWTLREGVNFADVSLSMQRPSSATSRSIRPTTVPRPQTSLPVRSLMTPTSR